MKSIKLYEVELSEASQFLCDVTRAAEPEDVVKVVRPLIGRSAKEKLVVVAVNARNCVLGASVVSVGTLTASLVHPREVFQPAILMGAAAVVVAHNHPSGDPKPSPEDRSATDRLRKAGDLLGMQLLDHVILGGTGWFSFRREGLLNG